ncbi:MAG TPA: hypothetical protein VFK92_05620 [Burkholderiales bacterium]|nr:hypothetical protein [Burkholderiales bacterium]
MKRILAIALALLPAAAWADGSIGVRAGTLGLGVEFSYPFSQRLGVRLNADAYNYSRTFTNSDLQYDGKATLKTGSLLLDWYPFANNFRISAGPMYNGNKLGLTGKPDASGNFTINGVTYSTSQVSALEGQVDFKKYVPYAGIGYGRPIGSGLSLTFDLGVVFQQSPQATLTATCGPALTAPQCTTLQSDVAAQQQTANDDLKNFRYYPVVTLGFAYTF